MNNYDHKSKKKSKLTLDFERCLRNILSKRFNLSPKFLNLVLGVLALLFELFDEICCLVQHACFGHLLGSALLLQRRYQLLKSVKTVLDVAPALVLSVDVIHSAVFRLLHAHDQKTLL